VHNNYSKKYFTFKGFGTYVAGVGPALLVLASDVANERPFLCESLVAELTAEGTLARVCPGVLV